MICTCSKNKIALIALVLAAAAPHNRDAVVPDSEFVETTATAKCVDGKFDSIHRIAVVPIAIGATTQALGVAQ